ncbi:MAG: polyketide cyclase [Chthoniobacteraceae bacterium]|nr:polyketide cyclase [Chthoniobacteraceae bacterium]
MSRASHRFLAFLGFLLVFPFFLRRRPRVEQRITILAPPEVVFAFLEDLSKWPRWTAWDQANDAVLYTYGDAAKGVGAQQMWSTRRTSGLLRLVRTDFSKRLDYELKMGPPEKPGEGKYHLRGRFDLTKDGACTRVVWRSVWERAQNPYMRYIDLFLQWMIRRGFSQGLANLKLLSEKEARRQADVKEATGSNAL